MKIKSHLICAIIPYVTFMLNNISEALSRLHRIYLHIKIFTLLFVLLFRLFILWSHKYNEIVMITFTCCFFIKLIHHYLFLFKRGRRFWSVSSSPVCSAIHPFVLTFFEKVPNVNESKIINFSKNLYARTS